MLNVIEFIKTNVQQVLLKINFTKKGRIQKMIYGCRVDSTYVCCYNEPIHCKAL